MLTAAVSQFLPDFLPRQRWFGGKAKGIHRCDVDDLAELAEQCYLAIVSVWFEDGMEERYTLLLRQTTDSLGLPLLATLDPPKWGVIAEAAVDPSSAVHLLRGFREDRELATMRSGTLHYGDIGPATRREAFTDPSAIRALGAEQSNTSLRVGSSLVFKLFRRLQDGENPELEIGRFLTTRTSFRQISSLEGSLTYKSPRGNVTTLGVLQRWVDNEGDGWTYTLAALRAAGETSTPPLRLLADVNLLGTITARFHAALASDPSSESFRPDPVIPADVNGWKQHLSQRSARVLRLLADRLSSLPPHAQPAATAVLDNHTPIGAFIAADRQAGFFRIRIHGDYHLGQTLKTSTGFVVTDFEGEPATPLAERRLKQCALKDVTGMLRSFDYAIDVAYAGRLEGTDRQGLERALRESFLDGYFRDPSVHGAAWLPTDASTVDEWLRFFELEKALYEVEYEMNNRPDWVHIPLRAISRMLRPHGTQL